MIKNNQQQILEMKKEMNYLKKQVADMSGKKWKLNWKINNWHFNR